MLPQKYVNEQTKMSKNSWKTVTNENERILDKSRSTESDTET